MKLNRRSFLKVCGATGAAGLLAQANKVTAAMHPAADDAVGMLVDTTRCAGCRACEAACSEANGLPEPAMPGDAAIFENLRTTDSHTYTVVNRYPQSGADESTDKTEGDTAPVFVKSQCMHCVEPACASACLVRALEKTPEGPVVYHADRCIGCRYCMVACPFGGPKFEYEKALPYIRKCIFCADRVKAGKSPACAEVCPSGALTFGKRTDLLEQARTKIYQNPDQYVHHIYGENEVGGTGWLYISNTPLEKLGFPTNRGTRPYPELTSPALTMVPFVLMLWPPLLMGLYAFTKNREAADANAGNGNEDEKGSGHE
jgi:formate dehydrogenase iron-sulfur subunit